MDIPYLEPPNKPMSANYNQPKCPTLYKDSIFMDMNAQGNVLVGTTNATGTFWEGSLQVFKDFPSYEDSKWHSYYNSSIIHCGKFIENNSGQLLISESDYYLKILNLPEGIYEPSPVWIDCAEHYEVIKGISLWNTDPRHALTFTDKHLTVWDLNCAFLKNIVNYTDYHTDFIAGIETNRKDNRIFYSVGQDGRALIWDSRMEKPAVQLYKNEFCGLTSISLSSADEKLIAVASESGSIYLLDATQPKEFLNVNHCFKSLINKVLFNKKDQLAVCGSNNLLVVYDICESSFKLSYKDDRKHSNCIQDLFWAENVLYTCGLQSKIIKHVL